MQRCGDDVYCDYPNDEYSEPKDCGNKKRLCSSWNCPIATSNPHKDVLEKNDLDEQYEYNEDGYSIDCDWMELYQRPKDAAVHNVTIKE